MNLQPDNFRILIVDDTPKNIQVLGTLLRQEGYQINVASNGLQALNIVAKAIPDLILLDVMMPELDGFQTCRRLKQDSATRDIPIIFLTAKTETEDIVQGFEIGAVDYVTKPFNPPELLSRVHTHLSLQAARAKLQGLSLKLSKYLPPQVYDSIFTGKTDARIESYTRDLTVLFSDIVGFTERAEKVDHRELTHWLNNYLNEMARICAGHGGTLDKFVGDSVIVFFGDPESRGIRDDAVACARMALEMQQRARELKIDIRIGINSGKCTVGNFGSDERMEYTILGKVVNAAARLEQHSEPGRILVSESTCGRIEAEIRCEPRGPIQVKGIDRPLVTYWVTDG
jgi:class 3 adenylate cyclase/CheY-like chemotaxis protein